MLRVVSGHSAQLVDAISINADKAGSVYGYDIYRNGQLITDAPVSGPCYTDHNCCRALTNTRWWRTTTTRR